MSKKISVENSEDIDESDDYFGKNIPFNVDTSDYFSRFDLSYLRL